MKMRGKPFNLETAVGSQKFTQALGAPRKIKKCLINQYGDHEFFDFTMHTKTLRVFFSAQLPFLRLRLYGHLS